MSADDDSARHLARLAEEIGGNADAAIKLLVKAVVHSITVTVRHGERAIVVADTLDPVLARYGLITSSRPRS